MKEAAKQIEDLECWKEARTLVKMVYQATRLELFCRDFGLRDQIQRAAVSVMANVAEGFDAFSKNEMTRFFGYASRSCIEVRSHLYVALDLGYLTENACSEIMEQVRKTTALVKGFLKYLNNT